MRVLTCSPQFIYRMGEEIGILSPEGLRLNPGVRCGVLSDQAVPDPLGQQLQADRSYCWPWNPYEH